MTTRTRNAIFGVLIGAAITILGVLQQECSAPEQPAVEGSAEGTGGEP